MNPILETIYRPESNFALVALRLGIRSRAKVLEAKMLKMEKEIFLKLSR